MLKILLTDFLSTGYETCGRLGITFFLPGLSIRWPSQFSA